MGADLYLLMPKAYETTIRKEWRDFKHQTNIDLSVFLNQWGLTEREVALGFAIDHIAHVKRIGNHEELLAGASEGSQLVFKKSQKKRITSLPTQEVDVSALEQMLVLGKHPAFGRWQVLLGGYSWADGAALSLGKRKKKKKVAINNDVFIAGLSKYNVQKLLTTLHEKVQKDSVMLINCYSEASSISLEPLQR